MLRASVTILVITLCAELHSGDEKTGDDFLIHSWTDLLNSPLDPNPQVGLNSKLLRLVGRIEGRFSTEVPEKWLKIFLTLEHVNASKWCFDPEGALRRSETDARQLDAFRKFVRSKPGMQGNEFFANQFNSLALARIGTAVVASAYRDVDVGDIEIVAFDESGLIWCYKNTTMLENALPPSFGGFQSLQLAVSEGEDFVFVFGIGYNAVFVLKLDATTGELVDSLALTSRG